MTNFRGEPHLHKTEQWDDEWDCSGGPISTPYREPDGKRCEYCNRNNESKYGNCPGCGAPL